MDVNEKMIYAPVLVATLCRSAHFKRMMESLKKNGWAKYTDVFVGLDYPPAEKYRKGWEEICEYLETGDFSVFHRFEVIKREKNVGSYENSIDIGNRVRNMGYDCWIYTDDDIEFSPNFLEYMDKCLTRYIDDPKVFAVTAYSYPLDWTLSEGSTCFMQDFNVCSWGIGFMRKKEEEFFQFVTSGKLVKAASGVIKTQAHKKMLDACFRDYFVSALSSEPGKTSIMAQETDVSMRAYIAYKNMYCVSPRISKSKNYGFDGSGEYCQKSNGDDFTAENYNYGRQSIDDADSFELVMDDNPEHLSENRKKLNVFDYRSPEDMVPAYNNFKLIERYGYTLAKIIHIADYALKKVKSKFGNK